MDLTSCGVLIICSSPMVTPDGRQRRRLENRWVVSPLRGVGLNVSDALIRLSVGQTSVF